MILIKNEQEDIALDIKQLQSNSQTILDTLGYPDFDLGILLTTNEEIQLYNKEYRKKDKPTDILSFPFYPDLKPGQTIQASSDEEKNLGDIIIAPQFIKDDLGRWSQTFEHRLKVLLVHGICHLLGYDHIEDADYKVMQQKESELLAKII